MTTVTLNPERQSSHDVDKALRKLRKITDECGTLKTLKEKEGYEKPTTKRKRKHAAAKARHKRTLASQKLPERQY
jgi:small subunit ribosomal protein S21